VTSVPIRCRRSHYRPQVEVSPSGEVAFIGEDDFSSVEFSGSALDTTEGLGFLLDLAA
jgi:hypothetical protein